jgi:hypothetical protein
VDYYLYVTDDTNSTFCYGMISAIGATCQLGGTVNRPILGTINLCPRSFPFLSSPRCCLKWPAGPAGGGWWGARVAQVLAPSEIQSLPS